MTMPVKKTQNWLPSIFNDFFGNEWMQKTNVSTPAINIIEKENEYRVEIAAPGLTKDDFSVKIDDDNRLQVNIEKKQEKKDEKVEGRYLRREFSYTQFKQIMILPENVDKEHIEAKVEHGVLEITIPKKSINEAEKSGKEIKIK